MPCSDVPCDWWIGMSTSSLHMSRHSNTDVMCRLLWYSTRTFRTFRRQNDTGDGGRTVITYIEAHIVYSNTTSATLAKFRQTFAPLGIPGIIVSDNESPYTSQEFFFFFSRVNGIEPVCSSPYHPASNDLADIKRWIS